MKEKSKIKKSKNIVCMAIVILIAIGISLGGALILANKQIDDINKSFKKGEISAVEEKIEKVSFITELIFNEKINEIKNETENEKIKNKFIGAYKKDVNSWESVNSGYGGTVKLTTEITLYLKADGTAEKVDRIIERNIPRRFSHIKYGDVVGRKTYKSWSVKGNEIILNSDSNTLYLNYDGSWKTEPSVYKSKEKESCEIKGNQLIFYYGSFTKISWFLKDRKK